MCNFQKIVYNFIKKKYEKTLDFVRIACHSIIVERERNQSANKTAGVRKEYIMEENMTDYQFKKLLQMVLAIINECETIDEAKEKINALLNE